MGKEYYIVTIINGDETIVYRAEAGETIMNTKTRRSIVVGKTAPENIPKNMRIERLTKDNKYKLKEAKKLTKKLK